MAKLDTRRQWIFLDKVNRHCAEKNSSWRSGPFKKNDFGDVKRTKSQQIKFEDRIVFINDS